MALIITAVSVVLLAAVAGACVAVAVRFGDHPAYVRVLVDLRGGIDTSKNNRIVTYGTKSSPVPTIPGAHSVAACGGYLLAVVGVGRIQETVADKRTDRAQLGLEHHSAARDRVIGCARPLRFDRIAV